MLVFCQGEYLKSYALVALDESFYIFGGKNGLDLSGKDAESRIAAFSTLTRKWTTIGELNQARSNLGVYVQRGEFVIVGDGTGLETERCTLIGASKKHIHCEQVGPALPYKFAVPSLPYKFLEDAFYSKMMPVPADFCPK